MAGYLRTALTRDAERQSLAQTLAMIRAALPATLVTQADIPGGIEFDLRELLMLVRMLASQANPQAAARITATINQQHPNRKN